MREFLLVDVGNTRIKFGRFRKAEFVVGELPRCDEFIGLRKDDRDFWQRIHSAIAIDDDHGGEINAIVTGSNARHRDQLVRDWPRTWPTPHIFNDGTKLPITIDIEEPRRVGIDRLLDAVAANHVRPSGAPAIVIDVGTATTVNAVSKRGAFLGGAILPGPELCARALHEYTDALPLISLDDLSGRKPDVIGRNTEPAIISGLYWGHWQAVLGFCDRMSGPLGCPPPPLVLLTGGAAHLFAIRTSPGTRYEPHLTLQGLAVAAIRMLDEGELR